MVRAVFSLWRRFINWFFSLEDIAYVLDDFGFTLNYCKSSQSDSIADFEFLGYELRGGLPKKNIHNESMGFCILNTQILVGINAH